MGICASKCFPSPTASMSDPESPRPHDIDKLVLSSLTLTSPPPPKNPFSDNPKNFSKFQIHPSPSSSSSSSSNPSTTMITSATNTTSTSYSYSSPYSINNFSSKFQPSKKKTFSDEYLLSCAKENPTKTTIEKEKPPRTSQITIPPPQYRPVTRGLTSSSSSSNLRQRTNSNISASTKNDQSIQAKRARSVSPASRTGRKVIRSEMGPVKSINSLNTNTTTKPRIGTPPLPQRKPISSRKGTVNVIKRDVIKVPTMEKEVDLVQFSDDTKMGEFEEEEVDSNERLRTPPPLVEDLNNPLIAMDCFIFL